MLDWTSVLRQPYPSPPPRRSTRWVIRATLLALGRLVRDVTGTERLRTLDGPFVAVLNHSQRTEAFLVPALLAWLRGGRIIRFLADWNFMLLPPVYVLYKSARIIPVAAKPARPAFLNALRPLFAPAPNGFAQARACLRHGQPVGVFPEGTTNRNPTRLLRGRYGAARLSLDAQCPVLPAGIRFPEHPDPQQPIADTAPLTVHVGRPLSPPPPGASVPDWHATLMHALSDQCGKRWAARPTRRRAPAFPDVP
jgi:1-acyl-sn-glycerol-3-phosphate acyltransferase